MAAPSDELLVPADLGFRDAAVGEAVGGSATHALPPTVVADAVRDPRHVAPADARQLTRVLLRRLADLEEGTREYSYVRATLIELNLSLVAYAIRRFDSHRSSREDLMQVGAIGLIKAIDRFDPDRGVEFTTFALPTVIGEIRRHFRDTTWAVHVPRRLQELRISLAKAQDELSQRLDRAPTVDELAEYLALGREEVVEGLTAANGHTAGSLDIGGSDDRDGGPGPLADRLGEVDRRLAKVEDLVSLKPLVAALPDRERLVLALRFTEGLTQSQIGARLGLSQMHVSRLLSSTLRQLREGLTAA
ncbi:RNA polymerase sigma factor SigF [Kitasatospora paracochleata]|uniref:RNA polymerase sigma-B factor n=1 Tax=Kitasatospora paracochleata TaxID=58354 RepID=A0ABT1J2Z3_9ACTN|nr:SigB/SigF/SigG family RNA polymerase sigma factor [Kitasatospora paracochleata]MCP2311795.1 RNA polymerase sigma-B factor [Kitasatospora paracochleata]